MMRAPEMTPDDFEDILAAEGMPPELSGQGLYRLGRPDDESDEGAPPPNAGRTPYYPSDYEKAAALLAELDGDDLTAWTAFCEGKPERAIARAIGKSRFYTWSRHLEPLLTRAGIDHRQRTHKTPVTAPRRNRMDSPKNVTQASRHVPVKIAFVEPMLIEGSTKSFIEGELDMQTAIISFEVRGSRCRISEHSKAILYTKALKRAE